MSTQPPPPWAGWWDAPRRSVGADLRVSDAERNQMADLLSRHYQDGRLDDAEFQERLNRTMAAKTRSDLSGLTADLPRLDLDVPPPPLPRRRHWAAVLPVVLGVIVAWTFLTAVTAPHMTWLVIVILVVLALHYRHRGPRGSYRHFDHHHEQPPASRYM